MAQDQKMTQDEYRNLLLRELENKYAQAEAKANALIPKYLSSRDQLISEEEKGLERLREDIENRKKKTKVEAEEKVRQAVLNSRAQENRLRNIFSNLGTAESSSFIDKMAELSRNTQKNILDYERGTQDYIKQIDTELARSEQDSADRIAKIRAKTEELLRDLEQSKQFSAQDKLLERQRINQEYITALRNIEADLNQKRYEALMRKKDFADKLALLQAQGGIDQQTAALQAGLNNMAQNVYSLIPEELDNELRGFLRAPSSGYQQSLRARQLMQLYPEYSDLIQQVFGGGVDSVKYQQLVG